LIGMRLFEALGTAALGILLMKYWGLWGYALATMVVAVAVNLIMIPRYACSVLEIPLGRYLAKGFLKPCLLSLPMAAVMLVFAHYVPANSWMIVIAATAIGSIVYILTMLGAALYSQHAHSAWWSLGVLELLKRRYLDREENLEFSANLAALNEFEKIEEQSVAE
jgi:Polysaccharide biosynthesis C-terminal domain